LVTVGNTTLSSNTSGIDEGTGFLDDFWNDIVTVISAIGSAATAFALYFVWKQAPWCIPWQHVYNLRSETHLA
jgi:hypothetical protein